MAISFATQQTRSKRRLLYKRARADMMRTKTRMLLSFIACYCIVATELQSGRAQVPAGPATASSDSEASEDRVIYGPPCRLANLWSPHPVLILTGRVEKVDSQVLEIVESDGKRRKLPSDRIERIDVHWQTRGRRLGAINASLIEIMSVSSRTTRKSCATRLRRSGNSAFFYLRSFNRSRRSISRSRPVSTFFYSLNNPRRLSAGDDPFELDFARGHSNRDQGCSRVVE